MNRHGPFVLVGLSIVQFEARRLLMTYDLGGSVHFYDAVRVYILF